MQDFEKLDGPQLATILLDDRCRLLGARFDHAYFLRICSILFFDASLGIHDFTHGSGGFSWYECFTLDWPLLSVLWKPRRREG